MMAFLLRTTQGPKEVSGHQIEKLRTEGKLQDNIRCISIDGTQTWVTYSEAVELIKQRRKDSPAKLDVAPVPVRESTLIPELTTASLAMRSGTKTALPSKGKRVLLIVVPCVVLLALSGWALLRTTEERTVQSKESEACDDPHQDAYTEVPGEYHQELDDAIASGKQYFIWCETDPSETREFVSDLPKGKVWIILSFKNVKLVDAPDPCTPLAEVSVFDTEKQGFVEESSW